MSDYVTHDNVLHNGIALCYLALVASVALYFFKRRKKARDGINTVFCVLAKFDIQ